MFVKLPSIPFESIAKRSLHRLKGDLTRWVHLYVMNSDVSVEEFHDLIRKAGFEMNQKTVMMFPVQVLSALFTREGHRRETMSPAGMCIPKYAKVQDANVLQLLERIQSECVALNTGWKCAVGWARKGPAVGGT